MEHAGNGTHAGIRPLLPLPQRAAPLPDEDLLSILRRNATKMGYPKLGWLLQPEGNQWHIREKDVPLSLTQLEYHILEELLLLPQEAVKSHTLSHYVDRLGQALGPQQYAALNKSASHPVGISLLSQKIFFLPIQTIRICPVCLLEQKSYDRLYWRLQLILYCPLHRVPLLGKCPSCGMPIAANRPLTRICQRCQHEYREIAQPRLSSTNFYSLSERFLLRALGAKIQEDIPAGEAIAQSPISSLSSDSYLYFLHEMTSHLTRLFSLQEFTLLVRYLGASSDDDLPIIQYQNPPQQHSILAFLLFHWLFLEWPSHFFTFLETWYSITTPPFMGREPVKVLHTTDPLFQTPIDPDIDHWLHQAYQTFHRQFRPDPKETDYVRDTMNKLAQSLHLQQKDDAHERGTKRGDERGLFIPPRFLTPTPPFAWESLGSVLLRAAKKVNHPLPEQLLFRPPYTQGSLEEYSRGEPRVPDEASDLILAYFLQIPEEDVPQSVHPALIAPLHLPRSNFFERQFILTEYTLISWLRPYWRRTTRVCLYCVGDEREFDRAFWNVQGVLCCPRHHVRLLERCPSCLRTIPSIRSESGSCPFCLKAFNVLPAKHIPTNSILLASTNLLLSMLRIPDAEEPASFNCFRAYPLLTVKPSTYFALLIAFSEEMDLYYSLSQQQLLQLCHMLGERAIPSEQESIDPYAVEAAVLLFHVIFSRWPQRFNTFLTHLYQTIRVPGRTPSDIQYRWRWLLANKWSWIAPGWFIKAFEDHAQRYPQIEFIRYDR